MVALFGNLDAFALRPRPIPHPAQRIADLSERRVEILARLPLLEGHDVFDPAGDEGLRRFASVEPAHRQGGNQDARQDRPL